MDNLNTNKTLSNDDLIEEYFARYTGKKPGDFKEFLSPTIEIDYKGPPEFPLTGIYQGQGGVNKLISTIQDSFEVKEYIIEKTIVEGNEVAIAGYAKVTGKKTGITENFQWGEFFTIENGMIAKWRIVVDTYTFMKTWGMLP